jgi:hypothetical protein
MGKVLKSGLRQSRRLCIGVGLGGDQRRHLAVTVQKSGLSAIGGLAFLSE